MLFRASILEEKNKVKEIISKQKVLDERASRIIQQNILKAENFRKFHLLIVYGYSPWIKFIQQNK